MSNQNEKRDKTEECKTDSKCCCCCSDGKIAELLRHIAAFFDKGKKK